ncbi:MAG: VWA domain-containing protein, partial [Bacteroidota bacterium]|nr:VWA domain-containing protein [Bacteroidota bacterium]
KSVFIQGFQKLRAVDEGALASFAGDFLLEQDFTRNKKLLADAAAAMSLRSGTAIYDAIVTASDYLEQKDGKKVIILLTDGVDNRSHHTREQAIDIAWTRGVPVYPIGLGFYPDPSDPFRQDMDTLRRIAQGTAGKAFFAPTSEDLEAIFSDIIESIYSIGCVLRYNTEDTCRDGATRVIDVQADVRDVVIRQQFSYTLQDLRSRLHVSLGFPAATLLSGDTYTIPVVAEGEVRAGEATSFLSVLRYDPAVAEFSGLVDNGGVFDVRDLSVIEPVPGELHIAASNAMPRRGVPYGTADELFALDLQVLHRLMIDTTYFDLSFSSMQQTCQVLAEGAGSTIIIHGCPAEVLLGFDTTVVAAADAIVEVPILLEARLDPVQQLSFDFDISYDAGVFTYVDFITENSVIEGLDVTVSERGSVLQIRGAGGRPSVDRSLFLLLRFRSAELKNAQPVSFVLQNARIAQEAPGLGVATCTPAIRLYGASLYADGICRPLLRRRSGVVLETSRPNPVIAGQASAELVFSVDTDQQLRLEIIDEFGRRRAILAEGHYTAGRYTATWDPGSLSSGIYLAVLTAGGEVRTQKILLTR